MSSKVDPKVPGNLFLLVEPSDFRLNMFLKTDQSILDLHSILPHYERKYLSTNQKFESGKIFIAHNTASIILKVKFISISVVKKLTIITTSELKGTMDLVKGIIGKAQEETDKIISNISQ